MKLTRGMTVAAVGFGAFLLWMMGKRSKATPLPGYDAPPPSESEGGTQDESPPESPVTPVFEGNDGFPRYATAMVSTSKGPEYFEKEYDTDLNEIRWINFKNPDYGSYRDIGTLSINHPPIQIYTSGGAMLWQGGQFTAYGLQYFKLPAQAPLAATVGR